jgi:dethiobiotin synthetase
MNNNIFITGIGTEVGKTFVSATLINKFQYNYFKPIQSGTPADSEYIKLHTKCTVFPETYLLTTPLSPHLAAKHDNINIDLNKIKLPQSHKLIVEGAGGVCVPINQKQTMLHLMQHLNLPVIIVASPYLGAINHTLLTINHLRQSNIAILGIIVNEISQDISYFINKPTNNTLDFINTIESFSSTKVIAITQQNSMQILLNGIF